MGNSDAVFAGAIPELYDRFLGPALFAPFAADMAERFAGFEGRILETAAGTGRVTRALVAAAPAADIVATDLNEAMIVKGAAAVAAPNLAWRQADAQALPFANASFHAVVCQFGVMFYPDKAAGHAEARRVLKPGGRYVFSVWDRLEANDLSLVTDETLARLFPDDPPAFIRRTPFGYHDAAVIGAALADAGFDSVEVDTVRKTTPAASAHDFATGLCMGSPLSAELEARRPGGIETIVEAVANTLATRFGTGPIEGRGQALVFTARV